MLGQGSVYNSEVVFGVEMCFLVIVGQHNL